MKKLALLFSFIAVIQAQAAAHFSITCDMSGEMMVEDVTLKDKESFEFVSSEGLCLQGVSIPGDNGPMLSLEMHHIDEQGHHTFMDEDLLVLTWDVEGNTVLSGNGETISVTVIADSV